MAANHDINRHSRYWELIIKMYCNWFYELPLASASGLKGSLQIGFS